MKVKRIVLTGGGTAGSVTPLLAVAEHLPTEYQLHFVGQRTGIEASLVSDVPQLTFHSIYAGKLRRYLDMRNLFDICKIAIGFIQSMWLMVTLRPQVVVSAGSYIAVPVVWAAWLTGKTVVVHQQDLRTGLATKLTAPFATILTKAFAITELRGAKVIGNPVRSLTPTTHSININPALPTLLVLGGSTGANAINALLTPELCDAANVIHVTGGRTDDVLPTVAQHTNYQAHTFLKAELKEALAKATFVLSRAGLGAISELAVLGKPAYIMPMPHTHQQDNADFLNGSNAAVILDQENITPETLTSMLLVSLHNAKQQATLSANIAKLMPHDAAEVLANTIIERIK